MSLAVEQILTWTLTVLSIVGVVLNIQHRREGFAIWMVTNLSWAMIDFYKGIPAQSILFLVYFVLSIWGFFSWSTKRPVKSSSAPLAENG